MSAGAQNNNNMREPKMQSKKTINTTTKNQSPLLGGGMYSPPKYKEPIYTSYTTAGRPTTSLHHEPALQRKKIIPYKSNHNILRTETIPHMEFVEGSGHTQKQFTPVRYASPEDKPAGKSTGSLVNEPQMMRKKIVPYERNHNIFRTKTVEEVSVADSHDSRERGDKALFTQRQSKVI